RLHRPATGHALDHCRGGCRRRDFKKVDRKLLFHLIFGPMVTLSLSREMFASFEDLDDHFPITPLKEGHIEVIVQMLVAE
ncbi:MAG: hypothetical protein AAFV27_12825, partial [Pseudomonadota bacterium]